MTIFRNIHNLDIEVKRTNRAKCRLCDDVIESKHRHDFVTCKCGEISVDGGTVYLRRLAKNFRNLIELSTGWEPNQ